MMRCHARSEFIQQWSDGLVLRNIVMEYKKKTIIKRLGWQWIFFLVPSRQFAEARLGFG